jgi:geranylgeranyl diphosphate synthase type II
MHHTSVVSEINALLLEFCQEKKLKASQYGEEYSELWETIEHHLLVGGKRLRPYCVLLAFQAYEGKDPSRIMNVAAAWELLHVALLIHDDIIDRDEIRHGEKNISGIYSEKYISPEGKHLALSTALLAGDVLISSAYELVQKSTIDCMQKNKAQSFLSQAMFGVIGGELADTVSVLLSVQEVDARAVATHKTAEYSLVYPFLTGAMLAQVDEAEYEKLRGLGSSLGLAYQLVDDLLGVFGNETTTGKSNTSDIQEKKRTVLLQETFSRIQSDEKNWLEERMGNNAALQDDDIQRIRELMITSGAKQKIEHEISVLEQKAHTQLDQLTMNEFGKEHMRLLVKKLCTRKS